MSRDACPICGKKLADVETQRGPFCSARCQMIDVGRWLDEAYGVPVLRDEEDFEGEFAE